MVSEQEYLEALQIIKKYQNRRNCEPLGTKYTFGQIRSISNRIKDGKSLKEIKEEYKTLTRGEYNEILWRVACETSARYEKVQVIKFLQDIFDTGEEGKKPYVGRYVNPIHYYLKPYYTPDIILSFDKILEAKNIRGISYQNLERIQNAMKKKLEKEE